MQPENEAPEFSAKMNVPWTLSGALWLPFVWCYALDFLPTTWSSWSWLLVVVSLLAFCERTKVLADETILNPDNRAELPEFEFGETASEIAMSVVLLTGAGFLFFGAIVLSAFVHWHFDILRLAATIRYHVLLRVLVCRVFGVRTAVQSSVRVEWYHPMRAEVSVVAPVDSLPDTMAGATVTIKPDGTFEVVRK